MRGRWKYFILVLLLAAGRPESGTSQATRIRVAVAANMQYAFNDIKAAFEKTHSVGVDVIIGASGNLTQQISLGAPIDLYVSADTSYPWHLYRQHFTVGAPRVYARGCLVLWTTRPGLQPASDLKMLLSPDIRRIAIANPRLAPYGAAAISLLQQSQLLGSLKSKLVYGENISQTTQFIATQNADIGFTAKAVVLSAAMKGRGRWIEINPDRYPPILQAAVLLKYGTDHHAKAATQFYDFLFSPTAQAIYKKYGYLN
ncbi:MAG: molybdate ABC transporter substrate-binding protein [Bacteroidota bacterium]|nr:molybdate ABC transporter substrate-binding protein [Bacteroidota bacterium]